MPKPSFIASLKSYMGYTENPTFMKDYKSLSDDDKRDLYHGLQRVGVDCEIPSTNNVPVDVSVNPRNY